MIQGPPKEAYFLLFHETHIFAVLRYNNSLNISQMGYKSQHTVASTRLLIPVTAETPLNCTSGL